MIQRNFKLALTAGRTIPLVIPASQYDSGEQWIFTLIDETGAKYTPESGAIIGIKSDKMAILNAGTVDAAGRVVINETEQMTAAVGKNVYEILINDQTHGTANFVVMVEPRPGDNADFSESDLSLLQQAIDGTSATAIAGAVTDWMDENLSSPTNPVVDSSLTVTGAAADAKKTGDEISSLKSQIAQNSGVPREVKLAMDALFAKIVVEDDDTYTSQYAIIHDWATSVARVTSITAVFDQSGVMITTDNTLNDLKQYLTVTASYSDGTTEEVTGYTLSGTLASGTSTITVTYSGKTATFDVTVVGWTLEWDYTDGALPSSDEWTTNDTGGNHTVSFESGKGIKWVGASWGWSLTPKNYTTTTEGILEIVANIVTFSTGFAIRATLADASSWLIAFLTQAGVKINSSSAEPISGITLSTNTDYTLRVERTANNGKVYLNGTLIYDGVVASGGETNNTMFSTSTAGATATAYIKSIRFMHVS